MRIYIATPVDQSVHEVAQKFDRSLFLALAPPFPPFQLLRFDGCKRGNEVHIAIGSGPLQTLWISKITYDVWENDYFEFIDEGEKLPPPLKKWRHRHIIKATSNGCEIIDEITYASPNRFTDVLLFPFLYLQFAYRKPVYQRYFKLQKK